MKPFLRSLICVCYIPCLVFADPHDQPLMPEKKEPPPIKHVALTAHPCVERGGAFITGEFIYWKVRQEELIYAGIFERTQTASGSDTKLTPIEVDFRFDPGFKLGVGTRLPFDGWDLYLNWTHLHTHPHSSVSSDRPNLINTERLGGSGIPFVGRKVKGGFNVMFNSLDLDWGRWYDISSTWTIHPSFGAKAAWIRQRFNFEYDELETLPIPGIGALPGSPEFSRPRNFFSGVGPYFSLRGKWMLGWGLGLYGQISTALLWGKVTLISKSVENEFDEGEVLLSRSDVSFSTRRVRPMMQTFVGIDWKWCFISNALSLNLRIGYESQFYWSQILNVVNSIEGSELSFEGFTGLVRLDF